MLCVLGCIAVADAASTADKLHMKNPFVPFGICMAEMKAAEQVEFAKRSGYSGLGIERMDRGLISEFASHPDVAAKSFRIYSALWWIEVNDPIDTAWLDAILSDASKMGMAIWMVAAGENKADSSKSKAVRMYAKVAKRCKSKGVQLVLYPHIGSVFETVEEGLTIYDSLKRLGFSEVRLSIHLSHELKAGNRDRIPEIVSKARNLLALATVNGADTNAYSSLEGGYWASAIKPLDQGTYDVRKYLQVLAANRFSGPIELHTYGLKKPNASDYDDHLKRSLLKWNDLVDTIGTTSLSAAGGKGSADRLHWKRGSSGSLEVWPISSAGRVVLFDLNGRRIEGSPSGFQRWSFPDPGSSGLRHLLSWFGGSISRREVFIP